MIVVESLLDREAFPWQADWYRTKVQRAHGRRHRRALSPLVHGQRVARRRRAAGEPAAHGQLPRRAASGTARSQPLGRGGRCSAGQHELRGGRRAGRRARVRGQRRGVQPVVVTHGERRPRVPTCTPGDELMFRAVAEVPEGTGVIMEVAWDFDGSGRFADVEPVAAAPKVVVERRRAFPEAGTFFPAVRVVARRDGTHPARSGASRTWRACGSSCATHSRAEGRGAAAVPGRPPAMPTDRLLDMVGRPGGPLADAALWHLEVVEAVTLSPSFRRVVVTAPGIEGLQYEAGQDLMLRVPLADDKVVNRRYTIRSFDPAAGRVVIDVSLHGAGPGTDWISAAAPGHHIDAIGPRGKITLASGRRLASLRGRRDGVARSAGHDGGAPGRTGGDRLLEVDGPEDEQEPDASGAERLDLRWLHRSGRLGAGRSRRGDRAPSPASTFPAATDTSTLPPRPASSAGSPRS